MACKSPTHKDYVNAIEGLRIQAWIAKRALEDAFAKADATDDPAMDILLNQRGRLDEAEERLEFGRVELAAASQRVDAHFARGCSNVKESTK